MEVTIRRLDENRMLLAIFSVMVIVSIVLILFKPLELSLISGSSETTEFQVILTPKFVIVKNAYNNAIGPYIISESGSIRTDLFPLKLSRIIEACNQTIKIRMWNLKICNVLFLKNIEINADRIVQKARMVDLLIYLREDSEESSNSSSCFKLLFENFETPHEAESNDTFSELLEPLTGHLYGGFYLLPKSEMKIIITWEPVDKPILIAICYGESEVQSYLLTGGEWSGSVKTVKDGLNCLVVGNLVQDEEIKYVLRYKVY
ncbi:MAG: hypothetical protein QXN75_03905 [Thermoproteota archaeon]|nr:hypothetical protein [Candidatus Brockarchaeota archaeon]